MAELIACCGLVCSTCPTFLATQSDDNEARERTVALYSKKFGFNLKVEDINCDGCLSAGGRHIGYCRECRIRECCIEKGLVNCSLCSDQPCEKLVAFHEFSPDAKACFEALKGK